MYEKCANYTAGGPVSLVEAALLETLCRNVSSSAAEAAEAEAAAEAAAGDWAASSVLQRAVAVVVPLLFGLIVLLGLVGNALVVLVVAANQQMRSTTNLLIINLASADLLFIVFCVPSTATDYLLPFWPFGDAWCKLGETWKPLKYVLPFDRHRTRVCKHLVLECDQNLGNVHIHHNA
ncbi:allatostatin-A receptor-like [Schistocerca piceifrons]|uniref:allatostatin-A receptor-like n=1 Tax=Schistocerca piceifrons TaxID=274613 RepID=UPI001F5F3608|nr:allatostatin-A receptor-like [Schistocerca piceifrons]